MWQIIGQNKAVSFLQRSLEREKLAHAYLFVGPAGVGKTTLALNLAQALNCMHGQPPCGECAVCQKISAEKHADVQLIRLAGNGTTAEARTKTEIGIDQIRQLQHSASLPPFEGKYRVYIIDGTEQMSSEAANCLLKTLEEPGAKVVFILLTTNEKLLLPTVISRCQRLELPPLHEDEVAKVLTGRYHVEPQKARLLSKLCHGCPGWAINAIKDRDILLQREERLRRLVTAINGDYEERFAFASEIAFQFSRNRTAVFDLLALWCDLWHDVMLAETGASDAVANINFEDTITEMASIYSLAQIRAAIRAIAAAAEQLKLNANPQLVLEVLMLSMPGREEKLTKALAGSR